MLDDIKKMAIEALGLTSAQVDEIRAKLLAEVSTVDPRAAAKDALWHPKGSTTRLENAVPSAQQKLTNHREALAKAAPKFLALVLAAEVAEEQRDDAEKMLAAKRAAERSTSSNGAPKELAEWYARLELHGVKRSYLGEFNNESIAILADLIWWKAKDARFRDPNNPWREVLGIYAERIIEQPEGKIKATRSQPGTPTRPRHISSARHYMFNEMFDELPPLRSPEPKRPGLVTIDCSEYPAETPPTVEEPTDDNRTTSAPAPSHETETETEIKTVLADTPGQFGDETSAPSAAAASTKTNPSAVDPYAEYAIPAEIGPDVAAKLRVFAEKFVADDDEWWWPIKFVIQGANSTEEMIDRVRRERDNPRETPLRYFLEAAERGGIDAGQEAYREATVRRVQQEMCTSWEFAGLRHRLGIADRY